MTVYVVGQVKVTDQAAYDRYQDRFMAIFEKYQGVLLAADFKAKPLEKSDWDYDRYVLMSFPTEAAFRDWALSKEYQEIAKDRKAGSEGVFLLVHGVEGQKACLRPRTRKASTKKPSPQRSRWRPINTASPPILNR